jgi:hypothetical protein
LADPRAFATRETYPPRFSVRDWASQLFFFFSVGVFSHLAFSSRNVLFSPPSREFSFSRAPTMATTMMALDDRLDETRATTDATPTLTSF